MDGYRIDPIRFRALLDEAGLAPAQLADQVGCHPSAIRHFCRQNPHGPAGQAAAEPSRDLADAMLAVLSGSLGRQLAVADVATPTASRWRRAS